MQAWILKLQLEKAILYAQEVIELWMRKDSFMDNKP